MYIAVLRGINVSGHHIIKMETLKQAFQSLGFQRVSTYIQSGNIVFHSDITDVMIIASKIKEIMQRDFGYNVTCLVIHSDQLNSIINQNPLLADLYKDESYFHVTLLSEKPKLMDITALVNKKQPDEEIFLIDRAVYLYCPYGYGKTKLTNNLIESKLNVAATTRNWKTLQALLKIASNK